MCGLVGAAGNLAVKDDMVIKRLLMLDYFRGPDATGLAAINAAQDVKIAKIDHGPEILFEVGRFKTALAGFNRVFIGHNRWATRGAKNIANAHPFHYGHIVGAHNGTLDAMSWNRLETALGEKFDVDSQALIAAIAKLGIKDAIELCTTGANKDTGAWSLVWYDLEEGSINFLRNKHRPMWYCTDKDFKRIYWASEWWMLDAMSSADEIEMLKKGDKGFRFFPTDEDTHYKFDVGLLFTATEEHKPKVKEIKGREPVVVTSAFPMKGTFAEHGTGCGVQFHQGSHIHSSETMNSGTTLHSKRESPSDSVIHWFGTKAHPYAGYLDKDKFDELAKHGCTWCSRDVAFGEPGVTVIEQEQMVLCSTCSGHDKATDDTPTRIYVSPSQFVQLK